MSGQEFARCNSLYEITVRARELKEAGESQTEINRLVAKRRAELILNVGNYEPLTKIVLSPINPNQVKSTNLIIEYSKNPDNNNLTLTDNAVVRF